MPKQVCARWRETGCNKLVELPKRYCNGCEADGAGKDNRPSAAARLYDAWWRRESKAFLAENPIAVDIFREHGGRQFAAEAVDHIIPHRGNVELFRDKSNWQGLTRSDHSRKTALEDGGFGNARKRGG